MTARRLAQSWADWGGRADPATFSAGWRVVSPPRVSVSSSATWGCQECPSRRVSVRVNRSHTIQVFNANTGVQETLAVAPFLTVKPVSLTKKTGATVPFNCRPPSCKCTSALPASTLLSQGRAVGAHPPPGLRAPCPDPGGPCSLNCPVLPALSACLSSVLTCVQAHTENCNRLTVRVRGGEELGG